MESLRFYNFYFLLILFHASYAWGNRVEYVVPPFGHLHINSSIYSMSLTTLSCGHPVKIFSDDKVKIGWKRAEAGGKKGFLLEKHLSPKRPRCFSGKFPKFVDRMNLDVSEMYYWGKLYDQYIEGRTKAK